MTGKCSPDGLYILASRIKYANERRFLLITRANNGVCLLRCMVFFGGKGRYVISESIDKKRQGWMVPIFRL